MSWIHGRHRWILSAGMLIVYDASERDQMVLYNRSSDPAKVTKGAGIISPFNGPNESIVDAKQLHTEMASTA